MMNTDNRLKRLEQALQPEEIQNFRIDPAYYERGLQTLHDALSEMGVTPFDDWKDTIAALRQEMETQK